MHTKKDRCQTQKPSLFCTKEKCISDTMDLTDDEGGQVAPLRPTRPSSTPLCTLGSLTLEVHKEVKEAGTPSIFSCQTLDMDGGSHSSEEELEEINNIHLPTPALIPNSSSSSSASPAATLSPVLPTTPVEFSTTPPNHVHKPRRSTSPPLVVISRSETPSAEVVLPAFHELRSQPDDRRERRTIGSKKRYKQSRIHHLQRPCLDFEKMQLVSETYLKA